MHYPIPSEGHCSFDFAIKAHTGQALQTLIANSYETVKWQRYPMQGALVGYPCLYLRKDRGVYLCSPEMGLQHHLRAKDREGYPLHAYAFGHGPHTGMDGDDFTLVLPIPRIVATLEHVWPRAVTLRITVYFTPIVSVTFPQLLDEYASSPTL